MLFHRHELDIFFHFHSRNAKFRRNLEWERSRPHNHPQNGCKRTKPRSNAWNHETSISPPRNPKRVTGAKRRDPDTRAIQAAAIRGTRVILVPTNLFASTFPSSMTFPARMTRLIASTLHRFARSEFRGLAPSGTTCLWPRIDHPSPRHAGKSRFPLAV